MYSKRVSVHIRNGQIIVLKLKQRRVILLNLNFVNSKWKEGLFCLFVFQNYFNELLLISLEKMC